MTIKNKKLSRFISLSIIAVLTLSYFYLYQTTDLFQFFNVDEKVTVLFFIGFGIFLVLIASYLLFKSIQQVRTESEILRADHGDLGVYNKVRNPFYSSLFLISSGFLLMTSNFLALVLIGINWLILTLLIIFIKESKRDDRSDEAYLKYMLKVNRLIPWFNQYFKIRSFNSEDQLYLKQAENFLSDEMIAPVMGIYFPSFLKFLWFRKGVCFATEKGIAFYSYDVFRGHYGQLIAYNKISSFIYGRGTLGYSLRIQSSNTSINLYFIRKGDVEKIIQYIRKRTHL